MRRGLLRTATLAWPALAAARTGIAQEAADGRRLRLFNTHTGEETEAAYFEAGAYVPAALGRLDWALRDHRTGTIRAIHEPLFDLLHALACAAGVAAHYELISGYRSPETNAMLAATGGGVATSSLHMEGRAVDVRLRGVETARLRDLALAARAGGVGYYARSDFVHLDLGRVRAWTG